MSDDNQNARFSSAFAPSSSEEIPAIFTEHCKRGCQGDCAFDEVTSDDRKWQNRRPPGAPRRFRSDHGHWAPRTRLQERQPYLLPSVPFAFSLAVEDGDFRFVCGWLC